MARERLSGSAGGGSPAGASATGGVAVRVPSVLLAPWAERAGYSAGLAASVADPTPSAGLVRVHVTLAPDPRLFAPRSPGTPPLPISAIGDRFGLAPSAYADLAAYLRAFGVAVVADDPTRLSLTVTGPAPDVGAAFGTHLWSGTYDGGAVRFPDGAPTLPAPYREEIAAISGLSEGFDRFSLPTRDVHRLPSFSAGGPTPARTTNSITASSLHGAYGLNDLYNYSNSPHFATGKAIAVLLWGEGFDTADLQNFFTNEYPSSFPQLNISWFPVDQTVTPGPGALSDPSHAPQELTLDLEYAGSAAPGASLDAVFAPDGPASRNYSPSDATMEDALRTAIQLSGVVTLSMSFGTPDHSDPSFQAAFETMFAVAAQRGITVLAASGDNGGTPTNGVCPSGGPAPQYPAASPQVLAVGGVSPTLSESVLGTVTGLASESAWNGSGGGFSPTYAIPTWQSNSTAGPTIEAGGHRGLADVAGPSTYNRFYYNGGLMAGNGTSFATPFWAGMVTEMDALLPHPLGFLDGTLYSIASQEAVGAKAQGLVDVQGETGPSCTPSTAGWDVGTGWGSPRAGLLFDDIIGSLVTLNVTVSPPDVAPGGQVQVLVTVLNATSHAAIGGLPVTVALSAPNGYFGPCGSGLPSISTPTDDNGTASASLTVPACYLGASLDLLVTVASNGYFGSSTATVRVDLIGFGGLVALAQDFPYNVVFFGLVMAAAVLLGIGLGRVRRRRRARRAAAAPRPPTSPPAAGPSSALPPPPAPANPPGEAIGGPGGAPGVPGELPAPDPPIDPEG